MHLSTSLAHLEQVTAWVPEQSSPVLLSLVDANTVIAAAGAKDQWRSPLGVWLEIDEGYAASLCARDVATLSWLIELDHVVVSAENARAQAQVVTAMLTNDEVNFANDAATIRGAFNRPAPPRTRVPHLQRHARGTRPWARRMPMSSTSATAASGI